MENKSTIQLKSKQLKNRIKINTFLMKKKIKKSDEIKINIPKSILLKLILIDFDDTLFPTVAIDTIKEKYDVTNIEELSEKNIFISNKLKQAEMLMTDIIMQSLKKGIVYIVTNASEKWIEDCLRDWFPSSVDYFKTLNIISARSVYEKPNLIYDRDDILTHNFPIEWKRLTFLDICDRYKKLFGAYPDDILSIGDGNPEYFAILQISSLFDNINIERIKFIEYPTINDLINQYKILYKKLF